MSMQASHPSAVIHRFWDGSPSAHDYKRELEEIHEVPVVDWTPESLPEEIKHLAAASRDPRRASNLVRAALLIRFGGLWVDHDLEPLGNLMSSPEPWTASVRGHREGCALWFPKPNHPMLIEVLRRSLRTPDAVGARILNSAHFNVRHEPRVIPLDANGVAQHLDGEPLAIHHWATGKRLRPPTSPKLGGLSSHGDELDVSTTEPHPLPEGQYQTNVQI